MPSLAEDAGRPFCLHVVCTRGRPSPFSHGRDVDGLGSCHWPSCEHVCEHVATRAGGGGPVAQGRCGLPPPGVKTPAMPMRCLETARAGGQHAQHRRGERGAGVLWALLRRPVPSARAAGAAAARPLRVSVRAHMGVAARSRSTALGADGVRRRDLGRGVPLAAARCCGRRRSRGTMK